MSKNSSGLKWKEALFSFGLMHAFRLALPLLALPWLGRVLDQNAFGLLMYMCLYPPVIALMLEWGFPLLAVRQAALLREDAVTLGELLRGVYLGKLILGCVFAAAFLPILPCLPHIAEYPAPFILAVWTGIARAMNPLWFCQGLNRHLYALASWDILSSLAILSLTVIFVRESEGWPLYLLFYAICKTVAWLFLGMQLFRTFPGEWRPSLALDLIKKGRVLFASLFLADLSHYGIQFACSFFLESAALGVLIALSKILRALTSLVAPFTQTIFPEICLLEGRDQEKSRSILRASLAFTPAGMALCCLFVWPFAPFCLHLALGKEFIGYAGILRHLLLAAPFAAANTVLAFQIMTPYGHERAQTITRFIIACAALPLAAFLAAGFGLAGASFAPLCLEAALSLSLFCLTCRLCPQALFSGRD